SNATTSVANDGASSSSNTDATTNQSNDSESVTSYNNASRSNSTNRTSNTPANDGSGTSANSGTSNTQNSGQSSQKSPSTPKPAPSKNSSPGIAAAKSQIGTPYNVGSKIPKEAFDCSGLPTSALEQARYTDVPRST